jgi:hypothetical protein
LRFIECLQEKTTKNTSVQLTSTRIPLVLPP